MTYIELIEQSLRYNRLLKAKGVDTIYSVNWYTIDKNPCVHLINPKTGRIASVKQNTDWNTILDKVQVLEAIEWIQLKTVCSDIFKQDVYVNKGFKLTIKSIGDGFVETINGTTHGLNTLYIKG